MKNLDLLGKEWLSMNQVRTHVTGSFGVDVFKVWTPQQQNESELGCTGKSLRSERSTRKRHDDTAQVNTFKAAVEADLRVMQLTPENQGQQ